MDAWDFMPISMTAILLTFIVGIGWLVSRDQDAAQERALACIEAGRQFVGGDCVAGPTPQPPHPPRLHSWGGDTDERLE